ncbi:MAG TPA: type II toxin-antitoxin system VapB family antitoxin [Candidatus Acidoferrales bacterium]|nr:type II toxin-antitoxin system VapB family antitoxin [Candidatus Acidoferrales bacterium]
MAINIKNPEAQKLARKLARLTGTSMSAAVTEALKEQVERVEANEGDLESRLLRIAQECAAHLREPFRSVEHGDLLYDEKGLPR